MDGVTSIRAYGVRFPALAPHSGATWDFEGPEACAARRFERWTRLCLLSAADKCKCCGRGGPQLELGGWGEGGAAQEGGTCAGGARVGAGGEVCLSRRVRRSRSVALERGVVLGATAFLPSAC